MVQEHVALQHEGADEPLQVKKNKKEGKMCGICGKVLANVVSMKELINDYYDIYFYIIITLSYSFKHIFLVLYLFKFLWWPVSIFVVAYLARLYWIQGSQHGPLWPYASPASSWCLVKGLSWDPATTLGHRLRTSWAVRVRHKE